MKKDTFVFYRSFMDSLNYLSDTEQLRWLKIIINYSLDCVEPDISGIELSLWSQLKFNIDKAQHRYDTSVKNGSKGGRPKKIKPNETQDNLTKPDKTQDNLTKPNHNLNKDKDKDKDIILIQENKVINKPSGFDKLLGVYPPDKVYSEHECLAIWDNLSQEEKQKVIRHSSVYVKELVKKGEQRFIKNLKSYLESRVWENVTTSKKKTDYGRAMTKHGVDGMFVQWVAKVTNTTFEEAMKEIQTCQDNDYDELMEMYRKEVKNG